MGLETLPVDQVRDILGEKLHHRIMQMYPDQAGKVTGMLLEMDNAEVAGLLDASDLLMQKADEAVKLLKAYADGLVATQEGPVANAEEALPNGGYHECSEEATTTETPQRKPNSEGSYYFEESQNTTPSSE